MSRTRTEKLATLIPEYRNSAGRLLATIMALSKETGGKFTSGIGIGMGGANSYEIILLKALFPSLLINNAFQKTIQFGGNTTTKEFSLEENRYLKHLEKASSIVLGQLEDFWHDVDQLNQADRNQIVESLPSLREQVFPRVRNSPYQPPGPADIGIIRFAARLMPQDGEVETSAIEDVNQNLAQIRNLLERSDLPESLHKLLLDVIKLGENLISEFHARGPDHLYSYYCEIVGVSILHFHGFKDDIESESPNPASDTFKVVNMFIKSVAKVSETASHIKNISEFGGLLLTYISG